MNNEFIFFKKNDDERFVIGPDGFNNNQIHSLNNLLVWKFSNSDSHTYMIVSGTTLLAYFTESADLIKLLKKENVSFHEITILMDDINYNNAFIQCEDGYKLNLSIGDSMCIFFSVTKGKETIISHSFLCDSPLNASQKIDVILSGMFHESFEQVSITQPDENGLPPAWMSGIIQGQVAQEPKAQNQVVKIIAVIVAISIAVWILALLY